MKFIVWVIGIVLLAAIVAGVFYARGVSGRMEAVVNAAVDAEDTAAAQAAQAKAATDAQAAQAKAATEAATKATEAAVPQLWEHGNSSSFPYPMRYQRRGLPGYKGEYEIVPQAWVEGESNCRVTNGSVRVCSGMWKGYADLVTISKPKCGAAVKKGVASTACVAPVTPATPAAPVTPATPAAPATRAIPDIPAILPPGGIVAPPAPATSGPAATVGGGV